MLLQDILYLFDQSNDAIGNESNDDSMSPLMPPLHCKPSCRKDDDGNSVDSDEMPGMIRNEVNLDPFDNLVNNLSQYNDWQLVSYEYYINVRVGVGNEKAQNSDIKGLPFKK
jgi:hypothetical protein